MNTNTKTNTNTNTKTNTNTSTSTGTSTNTNTTTNKLLFLNMFGIQLPSQFAKTGPLGRSTNGADSYTQFVPDGTKHVEPAFEDPTRRAPKIIGAFPREIGAIAGSCGSPHVVPMQSRCRFMRCRR